MKTTILPLISALGWMFVAVWLGSNQVADPFTFLLLWPAWCIAVYLLQPLYDQFMQAAITFIIALEEEFA